MRRLFEICQSPTKIWKPLPAGDHNSSVLEEGYFESGDTSHHITTSSSLDWLERLDIGWRGLSQHSARRSVLDSFFFWEGVYFYRTYPFLRAMIRMVITIMIHGYRSF
jgi:hypothetical protein